MRGSRSRRERRQRQRIAPSIEGLANRELPSAGAVGPPLGPYLAPATSLPKVSIPPTIVDPHVELAQFLSGQLGSSVNQVQQQADLQGASQNALVVNEVASQPFIHAVLSRQDTYTLLGLAVSATGGSLSDVYSATGPLVANALQTGSPHGGPNAPRRIPGLRLVTALPHNHNFPNHHTSSLLYELHVAVDRQVFSLSARRPAWSRRGSRSS